MVEVLQRLGQYESMNWTEIITRTKSHPVSCDRLVAKARKRLQQIGQDDIDQLFSLRMGGNKPRIWGLRRGGCLRILWWDPEHKVCPSPKR